MILELHARGWSPDVDPNQDLASRKHLKFKKKVGNYKNSSSLSACCGTDLH